MILDPDSDPVKSALVTPLMLLSSHPFHLLPEEVVDAVAALPLQPRVVTQDRQVAHEAQSPLFVYNTLIMVHNGHREKV